MTPYRFRAILVSTMLAGLGGCVSGNSPMVQERLKMVSAGHTGCMPAENVISNVAANLDGSGTWNATCKGKVYLCSAVGSVGNSESYSCAPAAQ